MDPDATLDTIRRLMEIWRNNGDWDDDETNMLVTAVNDLDGWMTKGGFVPAAWGGIHLGGES
jgi:hypothetical protein